MIRVTGFDGGWPTWVCVHERCVCVRERLTRVCVRMSALKQDLVDYSDFQDAGAGRHGPAMDERLRVLYERS